MVYKDKIFLFEIEKTLKNQYNLHVRNVKKNEESTDGNVYIVNCETEKYIVKVYKELEHANSMIDLHQKLDSNGIIVPKIISNSNGKKYEVLLNSYIMVVYSFIDGEQIGWNSENGKIDEKIVVKIAKELRKLHKCTENAEIALPRIKFGKSTGRESVIHFDLTRHNIFICKDGGIVFIDFDDAKYGASVCDLAILISNLFFSKTRGVDLKGMQCFIDEYYADEIELKKQEEALIKTYALEWINYILSGNEFDTSTIESFEARKRLISENLK